MTPAPDTFHALVIEKNDDGKVATSFQTLDNARLPEGEATIAVRYSSLNYKDGMILNGLGGLVRTYPHIPGVDFVGEVEHCTDGAFQPGEQVICTGWRMGETRWGGFATRARVPSKWLVRLPERLSARHAMALGTAGLTAMLALMALEAHGLKPDADGEVLITGASGGVGSIAVTLLASLGYRVAAGTGRESTHDDLKALGATSIVTREELETVPRGALASERWAAAIDTVGGPILGHLLAALRSGGSCAAVGLAASPKLDTTVLPFLLRGINLLGIDSVNCPLERRHAAWTRLARDLPLVKLDALSHVRPLSDLPELGALILKGQIQGRIVIDVNA